MFQRAAALGKKNEKTSLRDARGPVLCGVFGRKPRGGHSGGTPLIVCSCFHQIPFARKRCRHKGGGGRGGGGGGGWGGGGGGHGILWIKLDFGIGGSAPGFSVCAKGFHRSNKLVRCWGGRATGPFRFLSASGPPGERRDLSGFCVHRRRPSQKSALGPSCRLRSWMPFNQRFHPGELRSLEETT